jgi:hypothetical protein
VLANVEVRDEKGRRRLHGAFTGGFSAGYGGTVGSAEGFTPSQFVSSRSSRASVQSQRFEDFLDQEDLDSMGFGKDGIMEKEEYAAAGTSEQDGRRARFVSAGASGSAIPGPIMDDFIGAPRDPIGVKLLKLMGWRPGRSIGSSSSSSAAVSAPFAAAAAAPPRKVYGVAGITPQANPVPSSFDEEDDMEADDERPAIVSSSSSFSFPLPNSTPSMTNLDEIGLANSDFWLNQRGYGGGEVASGSSHSRRVPSRSNNPTDSLVVAFAPKSNTFGIGFDPHENASEFRGRTTSSAGSGGDGSRGQAPAAGSKVGGAFGYGVFEERDADEIDVYNVDQTSDYDYALDPLPGPKKSSSAFFAKSSVRQDNNDEFQLTATNNCPFKGFARALRQQLPIVEFPPPDIPRDFDPIHKFTEGPSVLTLLDRHVIAQLNPDQRGRLLGEQPLPQNPNARQGPVAQASHSSAITPSVQPETVAPPRPQPSALPSLLARRFHKEGSGPLTQDKPTSDENDAGGYQKTAAKLNMFGALTRSVEDWQPERLLCKRFNVRVPNKGAVTSRRDRERGSTNFIGAIDEPMPDSDLNRDTSTNPNMHDNRNESDDADEGDNKDEGSPTTMQEGEADESRPSFDLFKAIFEDNEDDAEEQRQAEEALRERHNASSPSSSPPAIEIVAPSSYTANDAADEEPLPSSSLPATAAEAAPAPFSTQFSERGIIKDFSKYRQERNSAGKVESDSDSESSSDSSSDSDASSSSSESDKTRRRHKHKHKHKHKHIHRHRHSKRSSSREKHRSSRDDRDRSSSSRKHKSHHSSRDKDKDRDRDRDRDRERRHKSSSSRSGRRRGNDDSNHKKRKHRSNGDSGSDNDSSSRRADAATSEKKPKIVPVLDLAN